MSSAIRKLDITPIVSGKSTPPPPECLLSLPPVPGRYSNRLPFLLKGKTAMLAAPGGLGKTQLLTQLAVSVASGVSFLGAFDVAVGKVCALFGEEDGDECARRFAAAFTALGISGNREAMANVEKNLHVTPLYGQRVQMTDANGSNTEFADKLMRDLQDDAWSLVVIDPASRFMGAGCETDNQVATQWIQGIERITQAPGKPAVLFAHHTNKSALDGKRTNQAVARGSSALTDSVRWQANLEQVVVDDDVQPDRVVMRLVKNNYGPAGMAITLDRDGNKSGFLELSRQPNPAPAKRR